MRGRARGRGVHACVRTYPRSTACALQGCSQTLCAQQIQALDTASVCSKYRRAACAPVALYAHQTCAVDAHETRDYMRRDSRILCAVLSSASWPRRAPAALRRRCTRRACHVATLRRSQSRRPMLHRAFRRHEQHVDTRQRNSRAPGWASGWRRGARPRHDRQEQALPRRCRPQVRCRTHPA
jgi:hypothetical protein